MHQVGKAITDLIYFTDNAELFRILRELVSFKLEPTAHDHPLGSQIKNWYLSSQEIWKADSE